jgi:hypothetical protein
MANFQGIGGRPTLQYAGGRAVVCSTSFAWMQLVEPWVGTSGLINGRPERCPRRNSVRNRSAPI